MGGAGGDQGGGAQRQAVAVAYGVELAQGEAEQQTGGQNVGVDGGVQPGVVVDPGEQPGAVQQPQASHVEQRGHRRQEQRPEQPGADHRAQSAPYRARRQSAQGEGHRAPQHQEQRGGHADDQMADHVRGELPARYRCQRHRGQRGLARAEEGVP
ncbi:hypothetical protein GCM10010394_16940 [Streptomyces crystallinus]|uniref:Uncharacterized protein n=1 Tax=Streptomyces crystallinus TaxID=68191 RepID=A0ABP3QCN1_9ACTN